MPELRKLVAGQRIETEPSKYKGGVLTIWLQSLIAPCYNGKVTGIFYGHYIHLNPEKAGRKFLWNCNLCHFDIKLYQWIQQRLWDFEVDISGSGLCLVAGIHISSVDSPEFTTRVLILYNL
jgi:hypothetical protein